MPFPTRQQASQRPSCLSEAAGYTKSKLSLRGRRLHTKTQLSSPSSTYIGCTLYRDPAGSPGQKATYKPSCLSDVGGYIQRPTCLLRAGGCTETQLSLQGRRLHTWPSSPLPQALAIYRQQLQLLGEKHFACIARGRGGGGG
jgi:hypothetical protein